MIIRLANLLHFLLANFGFPDEVVWHLWFRCPSKDESGVQCMQHFHTPIGVLGGVPPVGAGTMSNVCPTCGGGLQDPSPQPWVGRRGPWGWEWLRPTEPQKVERVGEQTVWSSPFSKSNPP
jgi:hypothetical protein